MYLVAGLDLIIAIANMSFVDDGEFVFGAVDNLVTVLAENVEVVGLCGGGGE